MRYARFGILVAMITIAFFVGTSAHGQDKKAGKGKGNTFEGNIINIHLESKLHGSVRVRGHKKNDKKTEIEQTFQVDSKTKVVKGKGAGKKDKKATTKEVLEKLEVGQHVIVHFKGNHAGTINIVAKGGANKKPKK